MAAARGRRLSEERGDEILGCVLDLLHEVGYDQLRMQDVADRAGAGLATIYRRWPTKQDLVRASLECDRAREHFVVTYDRDRGAPNVLGRHAIADTGLYSTCLAIENLWLAATAEGLGVGWVSFYREAFLQELLGIPERVRPVAWLCVGPVSHLEDVPDLERHGWQARRPLESVWHSDRW